MVYQEFSNYLNVWSHSLEMYLRFVASNNYFLE